MLILALETTSDLCSIAVRDSQGTLVERAFRHRMHLSERLMGDVQEVLADAGTSFDQIGAFAVGIGPGSFTGVRIGVTTVKTWADLLDKPVVGVSSLEALAADCPVASDTLVVPLIRARPGSVYYQGSWWQDDPNQLGEPKLATLDELQSELYSGNNPNYVHVIFIGEAINRYQEDLRARFPDPIRFQFGPAAAPRASIVAAIAERRIAAGNADNPLALVPLYVSPPPIDPTVEARIKAAGANAGSGGRR